VPKDLAQLEAPTLLLAMPQVQDPFFHRSVVFLIEHSDQGSFGLIANRPSDIGVGEILTGMDIDWQGEETLRAYFGGPVQPQLGTVLFDLESARFEDPDQVEETTTEVHPGLRITQHIGDLTQLAERPSEHFRLFLGYAGWGEGQLMREIERNDWLIAPVQRELLFAVDPEEAWATGVRSVGVDPDSLPSWTQDGGDTSTN
jgi:putative transcriptional regulator